MPDAPLEALLEALDLLPLGADRFEGRSLERARARVFGGELLAQAIVATSRTVDDRPCHALHANFLAPADPAVSLEHRVRRVRDGRRFALRQVAVCQKDREVMVATASFAAAEESRAVLAYASDTTLLDIACYPRGLSWIDPRMEQASLDHAMWFHRPFRADDWLLHAQAAPVMAGGRAFLRGSVFRRDGTLVASVTQEGLSRMMR